MAAIITPWQARTEPKSGGRRYHRQTCIIAGGLALVGGILAVSVDPWFAALAAVGGVWLIVAPEPRGC